MQTDRSSSMDSPILKPTIGFSSHILPLLAEFETSNAVVSEDLRTVVNDMAITGLACYPWAKLKLVIVAVLQQVATEKNKTNPDCAETGEISFTNRWSRIADGISQFFSPPFTLQRLCELCTSHHELYRSTNKFLTAVEKAVFVESTQEVLSPESYVQQVNASREAIEQLSADSATDSSSSSTSEDSSPSSSAGDLQPMDESSG